MIAMTWPQYERGEVAIDGRPVKLSPRETVIVALLLMRRGCFVAVNDLIEMIWPNPDLEPENAAQGLTVYVCRLRKKLGADAIENLWGRGFRIPREHEGIAA